MILRFFTALLAVTVLSIGVADAKHYKRHHQKRIRTDVVQPVAVNECDNDGRCRVISTNYQAVQRSEKRTRVAGNVTFLPHPAGCPRTAFCACGAAVDVLGGNGRDHRDLWPARAFYKFPPAAPAYKMVAVRSHHVFVLRQHVQGTVWLVADYNSGGHQSRLHERDIRGYKIVNPHGSLASL